MERSAATKNIVICCDGTGNQFGETNSNVVKLYACLAVSAEQVAYYHPGLGTIGSPNQSTPVGRWATKVSGLAFGTGFRDNMADAYRFLMQHYAEGDRVYLFGFSRGAYTVRALTGALSVYGLLCPGNEGHLPYLLENFSEASKAAYRKGSHSLEVPPLASAFKETFSREIPIHFVGVWDTVSSVGWVYDPVKLLFDGQNPVIRKGRHALSVDERRGSFHNLPWGEPLPEAETPLLKGERQDIVQAWFAGVHSDVGGGFKQSECAPAMEALQWMLEEAEADGLKIASEKRCAIFGGPCSGYEYIQKHSHPPRAGEKLHPRMEFWWRLAEIMPHVYFDERGQKHWKLAPWPHCRELPDGALLHPSLMNRLQEGRGYRPPNLPLDRVKPFRESPVKHLVAESAAKVEAQGFGVYRLPEERRHRPRVAAVDVLAKAAALLMGLLVRPFFSSK